MKGTGNETIMIVDDEVMVATALRSFLELETGYHVITYTAPTEALEALQTHDPKVIISDFLMPGMDGITFLRNARVARPFATRILLTGYADKQNAIRAINEVGIYHYFEKPWDNEHLKLVIRNGVERCTLFAELEQRVAALENANAELVGMRRKLMQALL